MKESRTRLLWLSAVLVVALTLSSLDGAGLTIGSIAAYSLILAVSLLVGVLLWRTVGPDKKPKWLLVAVFIAFIFRVFLGLGFLHGLPKLGYQDSKQQRAGYVFSDAYKRDRDALSRARSEQPLIAAFTDRKLSDQYGGLLFLSASIYRYLSPDTHRPMLVVTAVAAISSFAVLLTWAFYTRTWGHQGSRFACWLLVLYPEAAMLGASQMREPFLITSFAASLYGYSLVRDSQPRAGVVTIFVAVALLAIPISPPFAIAILLFLGLAWVWERKSFNTSWPLAIGLALIIGLVAMTLTVRSWQGLEYIQGSTWRIIFDWWEDAGGDWRINILSEQSAWLDSILGWLPDWADIPFLVTYGLIQPFLPASIAATGAPIWRFIAVWRSLGWYLLLPFLIYAPFLAIRRAGLRSLEAYLSIATWFAAFVASYRALGLQWDNPRYRAVFLVSQVAISAWVWVNSREDNYRWIKRIYLLLGGSTLIVLQWYMGRYYGTPRLSLVLTLIAVGLFISILIFIILIRDNRRRKANDNKIP